MKIVFISDTHGLHKRMIYDLPEGDVLVHCGDFTNKGDTEDVADFLHWFKYTPYKYRILIAGNHEMGLDLNSRKREKQLSLIDFYKDDIIYLEHSSTIIEEIKFFGSPFTPDFGKWALMYPRYKGSEMWDDIPEDTQILITHGPAYGILDMSIYDNTFCGCEALREKIFSLEKLKVHAFGHIHHGYGKERMSYGDERDITFINAAICNEQYKPINKPIVYEFENL